MAFLRFHDGHTATVSAEQGNALWLLKTGERVGTEKSMRMAERVKSVYLNYESAPESYRVVHPREEWENANQRKSVLGGFLPVK